MVSAEPASASVPASADQNENENKKKNMPNKSRKLLKGRLQPPVRNGLALSYVQIPKSKVLVDRHGGLQDVPIIEFCSTALPQPFVNPETRGNPTSSAPAQ